MEDTQVPYINRSFLLVCFSFILDYDATLGPLLFFHFGRSQRKSRSMSIFPISIRSLFKISWGYFGGWLLYFCWNTHCTKMERTRIVSYWESCHVGGLLAGLSAGTVDGFPELFSKYGNPFVFVRGFFFSDFWICIWFECMDHP